MQNKNTNLGTQNIADNLSRFTTHDAPLNTGVNTNVIQDKFPNTGFTGSNIPYSTGVSGQSFASNTDLGRGSELRDTNYIRDTGFRDSRFDTNINKNLNANLGTNVPITQENQFVGSNLGDPIGASGFQSNYGSTNLNQSNLPTSNLTSELPVQSGYSNTEGIMEEDDPQKKKGIFSKITGIFKHKKDHTDDLHNIEKIQEPPGILDEKGTTVSLPQGLASTSQLGLPITGPDYTHGTHGTTNHTVFTGGLPTDNFGTGTMNPMGDSRNIGFGTGISTTSMPVNVNQGNSGFNQGLRSDIVSDEFGNRINPIQGVDVSGANASHINRDITLQEGGLLGLRQGAVTGNPGDIITNYDQQSDITMTGTKFTQPTIQTTSTYVEQQPIGIASTRTIPPTHLGPNNCTLVHPDQKNL